MESPEKLVEMRSITKRFPGVLANDSASFTLLRGEVHALLGENGAGKTTLMNILYGLYTPDAGEIFVRGRRVQIRGPKDAISLGIGMVHQQFRLIPTHTVAENIIVGARDVGFVLRFGRINERLSELIKYYGWSISPTSKVWQLTAGEKQQVEILKALYRGAEILILDEPTSVLTPQETVVLFQTLRKMASQGLGVVLISHKLDEVMAVSDRVTVMRRGRTIVTKPTRETNQRELAFLMVGRELSELEARPMAAGGKPVLEASGLQILDDKGLLAVKNISLRLFRGEILGVAGVSGNGQEELIEALVGLRKVRAGKILLDGVEMTNRPSADFIREGVAYIPAESLRYTAADMTVAENIILKSYRNRRFSKRIFINWKTVYDEAGKIIKDFNIVTPSPFSKAGNLSGGNIQRLVIARELNLQDNIKVIVAAYPSKGLDVASTEFVQRKLVEAREKGVGIILLSEDLEELFLLSDRIIVMYRGEIVGELPRQQFDLEKVGLMMTGVKGAEVKA
ncbi:Ribose import ATP-binding protein RbsA [archaeon HR01]|nr:Ribose import ATP-binding protein RbsA [archaeon HR01]